MRPGMPAAALVAIALAAAHLSGETVAAQSATGAQAAAPGPATAAAPAGPPGAPLLEPYRFNARERTSRALSAWEKGKPEDAVAPLDSALRLQPGDPLVEFNAGTAHLGARQADAAQLLEQAAKHAPPALAADALYNLGNARLEAKDARGALDAYKGALRAQPDLASAKRNLELALRLLEEQQRQQEQQQKDQQKDDQQQKQQQQKGQGQSKDQNQDPQQKPGSPPQQPDGQPNPGQNPQPDPQQPDPQSGQQQPGQQERPLPQFQDQKDMTAEQAAAILQAVENLERQQRREQARAVARAKTSVEKDW